MSSTKIYNWNTEKNQLLTTERGISFERIVFEISIGNEVALVMHPNQSKYPGQMISMVEVDDYVYLVPFVETETEIFLKTIIPSRKATRQFRSKP
ncbi:MAG: BrnT family toxin [Orrella sp.]